MTKKTVVEESPFEVEEVQLVDVNEVDLGDVETVELPAEEPDNQDGDGAATALVDDGTHKCDTCKDEGDLFGRTQELIENVQNCLGEGAGLEAGDDISPEQDTQEPPEGENALETKSDVSEEIGGNDGVSFPSQEELDKEWPVTDAPS